MRLTNFFQSFNKGILVAAFLSSPFLSQPHIPKIPKKTFPLLTNYHCSFHYSAPLFKKRKPPQLEKQNIKGDNQDEIYPRSESAVEEYWDIWEEIRGLEIKFVKKTVEDDWDNLINNREQTRELEIKFEEKFAEKSKKWRSQKLKKLSYREKMFYKMCEKEASRNND